MNFSFNSCNISESSFVDGPDVFYQVEFVRFSFTTYSVLDSLIYGYFVSASLFSLAGD
jgi:hypothetical protein